MANEAPYDDMYTWYENLYPAVEGSAAYSKYCELVFGKDLSQQSFSTMDDIEMLLREIPAPFDGRILDLGCGIGKITEYIARRTGAQAIGLDYSPKAIHLANERTAHTDLDLRFMVGDMEHVELEKSSFDRIISIDTLYFTDDLEALMRRVVAWLKPKGKFIAFYGMPMFKTDEPMDILKKDQTWLAKAFRALQMPYTAIDQTEAHYAHMSKKRQAAEDMRNTFEQEGNMGLYEYIARESIGDDFTLEAFCMSTSRFLYVGEKA